MSELKYARPGIDTDKEPIDYDVYASQFDEMVELLPTYQDNIELLLTWLKKTNLPPNPKICDVGAGTGNFVLAMNKAIDSAAFTHIDANPNMNRLARAKYRAQGVDNVEIIEEYMQRVEIPPASFDLVVSVNALNTAPPQDLTLIRIREWMKPGAPIFLINFSRENRVLDWGWYLLANTIKRYGVRRYLKVLSRNRQALIQNVRGKRHQINGDMVTHTTEAFVELVRSVGFNIEHYETCYRGYSDLVIARA